MTPFEKAVATAMWFETGGRFNPEDPTCLDGTNKNGCGYNKTEGDSGGVTKYGIAQNYHPDVDVENLDFEGACAIYDTDYWLKAGCDKMPERVAIYLFDVSANSGVYRGDLLLQIALGVVADGLIGPQTITVAHQLAESDVLNKMLTARLNYYNMIVQAKPDQRKFYNGWVNRAKTFMQRYDALK